MIYRVRDWNDNFENNRTRDLKRLEWLPVPNKHDGDGYTELLDHPNGLAHFGAWVLILQVASKCQERGTLLRDSRTGLRHDAAPYDAASLARVTRAPRKIFEEALPRLISIGWLEEVQTLAEGEALSEGDATSSTSSDCELKYSDVAPACGIPAPSCDIPAPRGGKVSMEGNGMERQRECGGASAPALPRTVEDAIAAAGIAGIPRDFISTVWHQHEGTSWVDAVGRPITNWLAYVTARWSKERSAVAERAANRSNGRTIGIGSLKPQHAQPSEAPPAPSAPRRNRQAF